MSEPIYEFVRGEGWIVTNRPEAKLTYEFTHSGTRWVFEYRDPVPGECFLVFYETPTLINMERIANLVSGSRYRPDAYVGNKMEDVTYGQYPVVYRAL